MEPVEIIIYLIVGLAAATSGSLMGVGGGFMMVPVFIFMGFNEGPNLLAPVLSLFVIIFIATSASLRYSREKTINYRLGLMYAPFSIIGAFLGSIILLESGLIDPFIFKIIFSVLIVVIGIRLILRRRKSNSEDQSDSRDQRWSYYWVILWGFMTGLSASIVGIGGGLIAVPVLHLFFSERIHVAIATSLFIMIFTAAASTLWHSLNLIGELDTYFFIAGLLVAAGAVAGSQIGSHIQTRLKGRTLQLVFGIFMIGIAIPLLWLGP
ncbi:MAG: sulfite exporter TauE/SafE family protein [Candidatus Helarchaeota archaeon]|nr:sulfite exporter TauE/SafE family protein [Candidatus Helarchaeota archaeon]